MVKATINGKVPSGKRKVGANTSIGDYHKNLHQKACSDNKFKDKALLNTANNWAERNLVASRGKRGFTKDLTAKPVKGKMAFKLSVDGRELKGSYRVTGKANEPYFKRNWMPESMRTPQK